MFKRIIRNRENRRRIRADLKALEEVIELNEPYILGPDVKPKRELIIKTDASTDGWFGLPCISAVLIEHGKEVKWVA